MTADQINTGTEQREMREKRNETGTMTEVKTQRLAHHSDVNINKPDSAVVTQSSLCD